MDFFYTQLNIYINFTLYTCTTDGETLNPLTYPKYSKQMAKKSTEKFPKGAIVKITKKCFDLPSMFGTNPRFVVDHIIEEELFNAKVKKYACQHIGEDGKPHGLNYLMFEDDLVAC